MASNSPSTLAIDIGNSRIKLGRFDTASGDDELPPIRDVLEISLTSRAGDFDASALETWARRLPPGDAAWYLASVHAGGARAVEAAIEAAAPQARGKWRIQRIENGDVRMPTDVLQRERVGTDRLLGALAANRLRQADRAAVVVDMGTAITVDLVTRAGRFAGGAILPGLAMSAQALDAYTDALPRVAMHDLRQAPAAVGRATEPAIQSGIFWGAVGTIGELVRRYMLETNEPVELITTGGGAPLVADELRRAMPELSVRDVPNLVLGGIALAACSMRAGSE